MLGWVRNHHLVRYLEITAVIIVAITVLGVVLGATLIKFRGGRYARRLLVKLSTIRFIRKRMMHAYVRDLEKKDPIAARAFSKLERLFGHTTFRHTESSLSVLSREERRAYLTLFGEPLEAPNRAHRRHPPKRRRGSYT